MLARAIHEKLELAVLIERAKATDRRRAFAVLAEALSPQLHEPIAETAKPIRIRHHDLDLDAARLCKLNGQGRADEGREVLPVPLRLPKRRRRPLRL